MKVGIALDMLTKEGHSDAAVFAEHMALGDLAEPLGFDSLFALEHHSTGYAMSPSPVQLLSYYAGRTRRITLGTAVIVLPWHDPVRVAEEVALLDVLSGGRCLFGFGRGAASVEYVKIQVVGTPADCIQQVAELQRLTGMPHDEALVNMRLFADRVLPVLRRDPAFAGHSIDAPAETPVTPSQPAGGIFAPA